MADAKRRDVWIPHPEADRREPQMESFGNRKRGEMTDLLGFDPGSPYARVMDGIRARAIEDFRKRRAESASKRTIS